MSTTKKFKLYTKKGDKGTTSLWDSRNISKSSEIMTVLGDLDELSAHLGLALVHLYEHHEKIYYKKIQAELRRIQLVLLDIGSNIATTKKEKPTKVSDNEIKSVEGWIDRLEESSTPLREFILPGVFAPDAQIQVTRSVCRRLERHLVSLHNYEEVINQSYTGIMPPTKKPFPPVDANILKYVNRLSDYFFALARFLCKCKETTRSEAEKMFAIVQCTN